MERSDPGPGNKGSEAAEAVIAEARRLAPLTVPSGMELVITRNSGLTADEKVNELVEALAVASIGNAVCRLAAVMSDPE